jgi:hypothetical protein
MKGKIAKVNIGTPTGSGNPHSYEIKGEDGETYFVHIGDFEDNENMVYKNNQIKLTEGDSVEFTKLKPRLRACEVKKAIDKDGPTG